MNSNDSSNVPAADPTAEFAKELAKQVPVKQVYEDGLAPATKATGQILGDIAKTIQLALAPLQFLGAYQDRLRNFIDESVRRVPPEKRVSPAPQILGPIIEGIRYEPEGTPIDQMFSELLSRSMDSERLNEAHPSYPILIKQLSSDEAKMLVLLKSRNYKHIRTSDYDRSKNLFSGGHVELNEIVDEAKLDFPSNMTLYTDHLYHMGLAGLYQVGNQEPIYSDNPREQIGVRIRSEYQLTELGRRFINACT